MHRLEGGGRWSHCWADSCKLGHAQDRAMLEGLQIILNPNRPHCCPLPQGQGPVGVHILLLVNCIMFLQFFPILQPALYDPKTGLQRWYPDWAAKAVISTVDRIWCSLWVRATSQGGNCVGRSRGLWRGVDEVCRALVYMHTVVFLPECTLSRRVRTMAVQRHQRYLSGTAAIGPTRWVFGGWCHCCLSECPVGVGMWGIFRKPLKSTVWNTRMLH